MANLRLIYHNGKVVDISLQVNDWVAADQYIGLLKFSYLVYIYTYIFFFFNIILMVIIKKNCDPSKKKKKIKKNKKRYVGRRKGSNDYWLGLECVEPVKNGHDGKMQGLRYFNCASGYGVLVAMSTFVRKFNANDIKAVLLYLSCQIQDSILKESKENKRDQREDVPNTMPSIAYRYSDDGMASSSERHSTDVHRSIEKSNEQLYFRRGKHLNGKKSPIRSRAVNNNINNNNNSNNNNNKNKHNKNNKANKKSQPTHGMKSVTPKANRSVPITASNNRPGHSWLTVNYFTENVASVSLDIFCVFYFYGGNQGLLKQSPRVSVALARSGAVSIAKEDRVGISRSNANRSGDTLSLANGKIVFVFFFFFGCWLTGTLDTQKSVETHLPAHLGLKQQNSNTSDVSGSDDEDESSLSSESSKEEEEVNNKEEGEETKEEESGEAMQNLQEQKSFEEKSDSNESGERGRTISNRILKRRSTIISLVENPSSFFNPGIMTSRLPNSSERSATSTGDVLIGQSIRDSAVEPLQRFSLVTVDWTGGSLSNDEISDNEVADKVDLSPAIVEIEMPPQCTIETLTQYLGALKSDIVPTGQTSPKGLHRIVRARFDTRLEAEIAISLLKLESIVATLKTSRK
ncbi:hypothetical protein RFI_16051 [Reticulomyxa filosa]|uniref:CAP-Gly domain-containing protein n=1 Tax=Reticulomyxa filosa TaxID=46433 RepID=X6N764_RETFI|nr:hypothetical protein RFI_16051 [Reticulomyxa filosa]|eukprot:ETO21152.1 hypothetical protein RFI_16051 [Reticulomyxa filosa]